MTLRALVVDDSRAMRGILRRILNERGIAVVEAANGRQALELLQAGEQVQIALVDWNMPEMTGYEFVCAVRRVPAWNSMPIMMVTTEAEIEQMTRALEAGANEYVMKPFTKEAVVEQLERIGFGTNG